MRHELMFKCVCLHCLLNLFHIFDEQSGLRMSAGASRREVVQAGAAAAAISPFLGSAKANAAKPTMEADSYAPVVTVFDHRGCTRAPKEYSGPKANDMEDDMCIKVQSVQLKVSEATAASFLIENVAIIR